jgi:uncharacterized RDD family membrane protein YckC
MKLQIQTTQNVEIEYEVAGLGHRIGAFGIDFIIVVIYWTIVLWIGGSSGISDSIYWVVVAIPWFFYDLISEIAFNGQSIGKKMLKIKVARLDGGEPTIGNYLMRWMLGILELKLFAGTIALVMILINGKGQRLGDIATGTTVVLLRPTATLRDTIFAEVDEDYLPTFTSVDMLTDRDIAIIKEVVNSRENRSDPVIINALYRKVIEVLEVETELPPVKFLRTVVKDYNHITSKTN